MSTIDGMNYLGCYISYNCCRVMLNVNSYTYLFLEKNGRFFCVNKLSLEMYYSFNFIYLNYGALHFIPWFLDFNVSQYIAGIVFLWVTFIYYFASCSSPTNSMFTYAVSNKIWHRSKQFSQHIFLVCRL